MGNVLTLTNDLAQGYNLFSATAAKDFDRTLSQVWCGDSVRAVRLLSATRLSALMICTVSPNRPKSHDRGGTLWLMKALPRASVLCQPLSAIESQVPEHAQLGPRMTIASLILGIPNWDEHVVLTDVELRGRRCLARSMRLLTHDGLAPFVIPYAAICTTPSNLLLGRPWPGESLRNVIEQNAWPSHISMQKWWMLQLLLALIQIHACGFAHQSLGLDSVSFGHLATRLYIDGIGDSCSHLPRIPRQQAAVFADLFLKARQYAPSVPDLPGSEQRPIDGLTRISARIGECADVSLAVTPCFLSPELLYDSRGTSLSREQNSDDLADIWSFGLLVASIFHPNHPTSIVSFEEALQMAETACASDTAQLAPRCAGLLSDLPRDLEHLLTNHCLRINSTDRSSSLEILNKCLQIDFFPGSFLELLVPIALIFSLKGCDAPAFRCLVLEAGTEQYLLRHHLLSNPPSLAERQSSSLTWRRLAEDHLPYFQSTQPSMSSGKPACAASATPPCYRRSFRFMTLASLGDPSSWDWAGGRELTERMLTLWRAAESQRNNAPEGNCSETRESAVGRQSEIEEDTALLRLADFVSEKAWRKFFRFDAPEPHIVSSKERQQSLEANVGDTAFLEIATKMMQSVIVDSQGEKTTIVRAVSVLRRWLPMLSSDFLTTETSAFLDAELTSGTAFSSDSSIGSTDIWEELLEAQLDIVKLLSERQDGAEPSEAAGVLMMHILDALRAKVAHLCSRYPFASLGEITPSSVAAESKAVDVREEAPKDRKDDGEVGGRRAGIGLDEKRVETKQQCSLANEQQLREIIRLLPRVCQVNSDCYMEIDGGAALSDALCTIAQCIVDTEKTDLQLCLLSELIGIQKWLRAVTYNQVLIQQLFRCALNDSKSRKGNATDSDVLAAAIACTVSSMEMERAKAHDSLLWQDRQWDLYCSLLLPVAEQQTSAHPQLSRPLMRSIIGLLHCALRPRQSPEDRIRDLRAGRMRFIQQALSVIGRSCPGGCLARNETESLLRMAEALPTWERELILSLMTQDASVAGCQREVKELKQRTESPRLFEAVSRHEAAGAKKLGARACASHRVEVLSRKAAMQQELDYLWNLIGGHDQLELEPPAQTAPLFNNPLPDTIPTRHWRPLRAHFASLKAASNSRICTEALTGEQVHRSVLFGLNRDELLCQVSYDNDDFVHAFSVWNVARLKLLGPIPTVHQYLVEPASGAQSIRDVSPVRWDGPLVFVTYLDGRIRIANFAQIATDEVRENHQLPAPYLSPFAKGSEASIQVSSNVAGVFLSCSSRYLCISRCHGLLEVHDLTWPLQDGAVLTVFLPRYLGTPKALCDGPPCDAGNWVAILTRSGYIILCSLELGIILNYIRPSIPLCPDEAVWFPVAICPVPQSFLASTARRHPHALVGLGGSADNECVAIIDLFTGVPILLLLPSGMPSPKIAAKKCVLSTSRHLPEDTEARALKQILVRAQARSFFGAIVIWTTAKERSTSHDEPACILTAFSDGHIRVWTLGEPTAVGMLAPKADGDLAEGASETSIDWTRFRQGLGVCISFTPSRTSLEGGDGNTRTSEASRLIYVTEGVSGICVLQEICVAQDESVCNGWEARQSERFVSLVSTDIPGSVRRSLPPLMPMCDIVFLHPPQKRIDDGSSEDSALLTDDTALLAVACHDGSVRLYV